MEAGPIDLGLPLSAVGCLNSQLALKGQILENPQGEGKKRVYEREKYELSQ